MLLSDFISNASSSLETLYPAAEAHNIVLMLCSHFLGTKSYTHIVEPSYEIPAGKEDVLDASLSRLRAGEPVQYVLGQTEFFGLTFKVNSSVLIPRPETEMLVRDAVAEAGRIQRLRAPYGASARDVRVLDLCTGSGCIAWAVALSVPGVKVTGVDISEEALDVARSQDFSSELKKTGALAPSFIRADVLSDIPDLGEFDLVLSNPPYIMEKEKALMRPNVLEHEPSLALFVPDDDPLLFYRGIALWSTALLSQGGMGLSEINESLGHETAEVFSAEGFTEVSVAKDYFGKNRFVIYKKSAL